MIINTTTNTTSSVMKKLVEVANSSDNLDNVKSRFLQMVGELLDEFPKHNFKDELEKINYQPKLFQIITKKNFQKKEFTFSDLFTDDVNEVIKELQHNSDSGMIGFVSKRFRVSDYEKILLCILNSTVFYNVRLERLTMEPEFGGTIALFNLASAFSGFSSYLNKIEIKLEFVKENKNSKNLSLIVSNKEEILESIFKTVELMTEVFCDNDLKEFVLSGFELANQRAVKFAPNEFIAIEYGYILKFENLYDYDELTIITKIKEFNHLLRYSFEDKCPYHNDFYLKAKNFYHYFYYDGYLQDQTVSAFQKAFRTRFQNVDYIFSSFQKNILKFCPRLSDWVYNSEFKQTNQRLSQESNVKVLDEDFFNLF